MVQFVNIRQLKNHVSQIIVMARKGDVVVTSHGKPMAVLHTVGEENLEDYLLAHSPKFLKSLAAAYQGYRRRGGIRRERLLANAEREIGHVRR